MFFFDSWLTLDSWLILVGFVDVVCCGLFLGFCTALCACFFLSLWLILVGFVDVVCCGLFFWDILPHCVRVFLISG